MLIVENEASVKKTNVGGDPGVFVSRHSTPGFGQVLSCNGRTSEI